MRDRFLSTLSLVCRIPIPARFVFDLSRADLCLPLIGILPALAGFAALKVSLLLFDGVAVAAALVLITQYLTFNLFHFDGLVDTADAFLGKFEREKRFAILKDSRIGVYGLFAGASLLILKAALISTLLSRPGGFLFFGAYPITGRWAAALVPCLTKPAKPAEGLGALLAASKVRRALIGLVFSLGLFAPLVVLGADPLIPLFLFPAPVIAGVPVAFCVAGLYKRHLGGYTGDALGATVELGELAHLAASLVMAGGFRGLAR